MILHLRDCNWSSMSAENELWSQPMGAPNGVSGTKDVEVSLDLVSCVTRGFRPTQRKITQPYTDTGTWQSITIGWLLQPNTGCQQETNTAETHLAGAVARPRIIETIAKQNIETNLSGQPIPHQKLLQMNTILPLAAMKRNTIPRWQRLATVKIMGEHSKLSAWKWDSCLVLDSKNEQVVSVYL